MGDKDFPDKYGIAAGIEFAYHPALEINIAFVYQRRFDLFAGIAMRPLSFNLSIARPE